MIILNAGEGSIAVDLEGVATATGIDLYAVALFRDGSSEDVGGMGLRRNTGDYSVIYSPEEVGLLAEIFNGRGTIQFTEGELDAIFIGGGGPLARDGEWIELNVSGAEIATRATNGIVVEFLGDGAIDAYAIKVEGYRLPTIKREAPTLWGRGFPGPISVTWEDR